MASNIIMIVLLAALFGGLLFIVLRLFKDVDKMDQSLNAANMQALEAQKQVDQFRGEAERLKLGYDQASRKDADFERLAADVKRSAADLQAKTQELMSKEQELKSLAIEAEGLRSKLKTEIAKGAQYKDADERLEKMKADAARKDQDVQALRRDLMALQTVQQDAAAKAEALSQKEKELQQVQSECQRLNGVLAAATEDAQKVKAAIESNAAALAEKDKEMQPLKAEVQRLTSELAEKEIEVKRLMLEMGKLECRPPDTSVSDAQLAEKDKELQRLNNEFQQVAVKAKEFKDSLADKAAELGAKEREIERLTAALGKERSQSGELERLRAEYQGYDERVKKLKDAEGDISRLERSLEEEKHSLREVRLRAQESRMKLDLIGEKTKESVEAIAGFAESKEFDEFRKAVHMDETIRKYEDEIKHLKIQLIELEKKV